MTRMWFDSEDRVRRKMSAIAPRQVTFKDLAEEAKKRIVFLAICVVGLSYLMSLTSSSVWVNLPAAATLIILLRYFSLDFDVRKKAATYISKRPATDSIPQKKHVETSKVIKKSDWRKKVDSQAVEDAIDHFTRHIVSEWVTDLWYSRITPDKDGPEELVQIINDVLAEISTRARNVNLIDLLTRDLVTLICTHLEIFRLTQAKIEKQQLESITIENRDTALRHVMASENKLHPALFSVEAEHKVLQHLVDGLMSFTFKPEDLQCCFFRYVARELLACAVLRPILNLANPRFINERIEGVYISKTNAEKAALVAQELMQSKSGPPRVSADHFSRFLDPTGTGVELVQLKTKKFNSDDPEGDSKDPLLSIDTRSSRSLGSMSANSQNGSDKTIQRHRSGGEWGEMLDLISRRKAQALAPEHFENMWTKGRNYKRKEGENRLIEQVPQNFSPGRPVSSDNPKAVTKPMEKGNTVKRQTSRSNVHVLQSGGTATHADKSIPDHSGIHEDDEHSHMRLQETDSGSTSYTSDDEGTDTVTGLGSPGTKVWDGKSKRNADSHIHHPLEAFEGNYSKKTNRGQLRYPRFPNGQSGRKRSRVSRRNAPVWHEVERTSFLSGDGQDILSVSKGYGNGETSSDDTDDGILDRATSGTAASSSAISASLPEYHTSAVKSLQNELVLDNFLKLRCEVIGANIVRSESKTFAVYSLSVTDANNNNWSVKRRFRHFEELHRRLKAFPEYNLHLPPKHFLSTGLDVLVIQERCRWLDGYLKKLMQLPGISGSIEVWDFLSVDSQTYYFSNSFSIVETLSVNMDNKPSAKSKTMPTGPTVYPLARKECSVPESKGTAMQMKHSPASDGLRLNGKGEGVDIKGNGVKEETSEILNDADNDSTLPSEWVPPNLSVPLLDLVDVIFQLQDGGWIRRKAFWVAKQVLQLGMSDAFDDWLIEKIQLLRRGSVVASGIKRVEQILWPDGIFITKHPKRQKQPPPGSSPRTPKSPQSSEIASPALIDEQQLLEADRRAKLVYEIMIDRAPAAIVSLVGRREYEQCAKDLYYFLQSKVCLKLLAFDLLELLLLSAFPELDYIFKQLHEEKHRFGEFKES